MHTTRPKCIGVCVSPQPASTELACVEIGACLDNGILNLKLLLLNQSLGTLRSVLSTQTVAAFLGLRQETPGKQLPSESLSPYLGPAIAVRGPKPRMGDVLA